MILKRNITLFFLLSLFVTSCTSNSSSPKFDPVAELLNSVNTDTLETNLNILSGELSVMIDGVEETITSRHSYSGGNEIAADYLEQKLTQYGYTVTNDLFSSDGRNVIAELQGTQFPDQYYIICAHYDSMPLKGKAPGADDNGSGTVAVLEAARILKESSPKYSIIFALWDEEEQGLYGSKHYANNASDENKNILGVINLDMIGYDSDNDNSFTYVVLDEDHNSELVNEGIKVNEDYDLKLQHNFLYGRTYSDHASFWQHDYEAILIIEDYQDFNDYYHTSEDKIENVNLPFLNKTTKLALGILAKLAL